MAAKSNNIVELKDIKKLLQIVLRNWYIIIVAGIISLILAYFYSYKLPKIYAAKTQILLQGEEMYPIKQGLFGGLGEYSSFEKISNQKKVLTSTDIIANVVSRLKLDVSYYIVGRIQTKEVFAGTPFKVEAQIYNYDYYDLPFIFKIVDKDNYEISYIQKNNNHVIIKGKFGEPLINKDYYLQINKSSSLIDNSTAASLKEITYQFQVHNQQSLVYQYKEALSVENIEYTAILEVSMEDELPERATMF